MEAKNIYEEAILSVAREDMQYEDRLRFIENDINSLCRYVTEEIIAGQVNFSNEQTYHRMFIARIENITIYLHYDSISVNGFNYTIPISLKRDYSRIFNALEEVQQKNKTIQGQ